MARSKSHYGSAELLRPHVPAAALEPLRVILSSLPVVLQIERPRASKHGDHRLSPCGTLHRITVNAGPNPYQFLITLLHELAHALTVRRYGTRVNPHGAEWKAVFGDLLGDFLLLQVFPATLIPAVRNHSRYPTFSSAADPALQRALRQFEPHDERLTVEELQPGQAFRLGSDLVLIRGRLLRKRYECHTPTGQKYHVSAIAKVTSLVDLKGKPHAKAS